MFYYFIYLFEMLRMHSNSHHMNLMFFFFLFLESLNQFERIPIMKEASRKTVTNYSNSIHGYMSMKTYPIL